MNKKVKNKTIPVINLDELKAKLSFINPKDYFTKTPISEIFKTSYGFKIALIKNTENYTYNEIPGTKIIKLTFMWNASVDKKKLASEQIWYMDTEEFFRMKTRFVIIEKKTTL